MINRATSDRLDDAIDEFEDDWSPASRAKIGKLLSHHGLASDHESIAELIRIDIELRYDQDQPIELQEYFEQFDELMQSPEYVAEIAFEDFRSRTAKGHSISAERWRGLPGVSRETWFQQIIPQPVRKTTSLRATELELDATFETALEEAGFTLVHQIGDGAMGKVYLGRQSELSERYVVLKIVNEALREPESMARLQHTNIVPIYSFHRILTRSVICMPYAGSVTLADIMRTEDGKSMSGGESLISTVVARVNDTRIATIKQLDQDAEVESTQLLPAADENAVLTPLESFKSFTRDQLAAWVFLRLASALQHSHGRGVLHNDLKPSNILIRNDGEPALLDFNLSQSLESGTTRYLGGTLPYMSPETFRAMMGQSVTPGPASDIYGLGIILFEFVTGRLPYAVPSSTADVDLEPAIEFRRAPPSWLPSDTVSPGLKSIVDRCLQFDAADRYLDAGQLQFDLQCEHQDLPLANTSEPLHWRSRKWIRRNPRLSMAAVLACLLAVLVVPLARSIKDLRLKTEKWSSIAHYESFAAESARVLSSLMADPQRREESGIRAGLQPLEKYGLLEPEGIDHLLSHKDLAAETKARETLFRHLAQVAIFEVDRLTNLKSRGPIGNDALQRLDRLSNALAHTATDIHQSRSHTFLRADRASLVDEVQEANRLKNKAERLRIVSDSETYLEAVRCLSKSRFRKASELLTSLADRNTIPSAVRWTALGRTQFREGHYEEARISFTQSIDYAKVSAKLYVLRGICCMRLKDGPQAEDDFRKAIELNPNYLPARMNLGIQYLGRQNFGEAIAAFDGVIERSPKNINALLYRSRAHENAGNTEASKADLQLALKTPVDDAPTLITRALRLTKIDPELALVDLNEAIRLEPKRTIALMLKAQLLAGPLERVNEAIDVYRQVTEIEEENETALIDRAVLLARQGRFHEAMIDTKKAMSPPSSARTVFHAACVNALNPSDFHKQRAVVLLAQAIQMGHHHEKGFRNDEDLKSLRGREGFETVIRAYQISRSSRLAMNVAQESD